MPLWNSSLLNVISQERNKGRSIQPAFHKFESLYSFLGGVIPISCLGILGDWSGYQLLVAPFGASTVLLFGTPSSPLA